MLMLFHPFRHENELPSNGTFSDKLANPSVIQLVNENKQIFEPNSDLIDMYWLQIQNSNSIERHMYENDDETEVNNDETELDNGQDEPVTSGQQSASLYSNSC